MMLLGLELLIIIIIGIAVVPFVFFLINLSKTIQACSTENQMMNPGHVWLNFIPLFSLGWIIYTVIKVNESLEKEYLSRGKDIEKLKGAKGVGLAFGICCPCSIIPGVSIGAIVLFIIYWVKTYNIRLELNKNSI